jgi:Holliday junction DNA helicase RuvA
LAERMIVELKDKFVNFAPVAVDSTVKPEASSQKMQDAVSALINLGYKKPEIEKTVRDVLKNRELSLEDVLRETLRQMGH